MTEFTVAVYKNPTEHKIRLQAGAEVGRANHGVWARGHVAAESAGAVPSERAQYSQLRLKLLNVPGR